MAEPVDAYLEHFGVRGMKWGKHSSSPSSPTKQPRSAAEIADRSAKRKAAFKTGAKVAGAVAIAAGAAIIAHQLSKSGNTQMSALMMDVAKNSISKAKPVASNTSLILTPSASGNRSMAGPTMPSHSVAAGKGMFDDLIKQQSNMSVRIGSATRL